MVRRFNKDYFEGIISNYKGGYGRKYPTKRYFLEKLKKNKKI